MRQRLITKAVQQYDKNLFCDVNYKGILCIYRKSKTYDLFDVDGGKLFVTRPLKQYVCALTDTWNELGKPVDWGLLPIVNRLKAIDLASNPRLFEDLISSYEKAKESEERDFKNNVESFLLDFRKQFARSFNDVNTSTMEKIDRRRVHDGYRK